MALPPKYLFTVLEASVRWACAQAEIINWAIADELDLVAGFPAVEFGDDAGGGLMSVAGSEVRPLFRPFGDASKKVSVRMARPPISGEWRTVSKPPDGIRVTAADIMITAAEIERFEEAHGIARNRNSGPGAPPRYSWDRFYIALIRRLFLDGLPETQRELVTEMQEWFIADSANGDAPDESTIRKRVQAVWRELSDGA